MLAAGARRRAGFTLAGLIVDETKMAENFEISRGLILAEAVMMGLAPRIRRQDPTRSMRRQREKSPLQNAFSTDSRGSRRIDRATIDRLTSPKDYLGIAA